MSLKKRAMTQKMETNKKLFIKRTIEHMRRVHNNMILLENNRERLPFKIKEWELIRRGIRHDLSKFSEEIVDGFIIITEFYRNQRLGKSNSHINKKEFDFATKRHREIERHHAHDKSKKTDLDICEMCCDLVAMSQEFKEEDYTDYFKTKLLKQIPFLKNYEEKFLNVLTLLQELNLGNNKIKIDKDILKKNQTTLKNFNPRLPIAIENVYNSFLKEMMRYVFKITNQQAKLIKSSFFTQKEKENTIRTDDNEAKEIVKIFDDLKKKYKSRYSDKRLRKMAESLFNQTNEFNRLEQSRMLNAQTKNLTQRQISNEIVLGNTSQKITATKQVFIENNVKLIKSIPNKFFADLEQDVMRIVEKQGRAKELAEQLTKRYGASKKKADLIARDQISKLNGNLAQQRQEDVGVKKYIWETSQDERVRSSHRSKQGKVFSWNDPPSDTGHPSEDYRCRCVAIGILE